MSDDLIKRDDALATIDTFKRNFEQPWKVQFSADIRALPAVDLSERIEQSEAKLAKAVEALRELVTCVEDGCYCSEAKMAGAMDDARTALAELEGMK
jgi:hypothetical protein